MSLVPVKVAFALQTPGGQPEDKGVAPLVQLSIGTTCCGYRFHWGSGGDCTMTPSEKNK